MSSPYLDTCKNLYSSLNSVKRAEPDDPGLRECESPGTSAPGRAEAAAALDQVRREFLDRRIAFDAAVASLELAVLYLEDGRSAEVKACGLAWHLLR